MQSIFPQWMQDLNTGLSLLGFVITVMVLYEVRDIKNSFRRRARLPEIFHELSRLSKDLNAHIYNLPSERNKVRELIRQAGILLETSGSVMAKPEKVKIKKIASKIEESSKQFDVPKASDKDSFWNLYLDIQDGITLIQQILNDTKWE